MRSPLDAPSPVPGWMLGSAAVTPDTRSLPSVPRAAAAAARSSASGAVPNAHGTAPASADVAGQAPGVDARQGRDAVTAQEGLEALRGPPVGRLIGQVAHHDAAAVGATASSSAAFVP